MTQQAPSQPRSQKRPASLSAHPDPSSQAPTSSQLATLARSLLESLNADKADVTALTQLLHEEKALLEGRDHALLERYAEQKSQLVINMNARNQSRVQLLKQHRFNADAESWRKTIETIQSNSGIPLLTLWDSIEVQLKDCQKQLHINEKILGGMQQGVARFLNLLRGQTGSSQTYNATGHTENHASNAPIIRA